MAVFSASGQAEFADYSEFPGKTHCFDFSEKRGAALSAESLFLVD
jgi:hypothetical protein